MSAGFENMGAEYFLERDSRIRKKVEKWKKFYEDADFSAIYDMYIKPMLL
jgi:ketosteroid isomerase-like protein